MAPDYPPQSKMSHLRIDAFLPAYFTFPMNFSKSAAEAPKSGLNPASCSKYPCFILALSYQHPWYEVVCIHMALRYVKRWGCIEVGWTWLRLLVSVFLMAPSGSEHLDFAILCKEVDRPPSCFRNQMMSNLLCHDLATLCLFAVFKKMYV
jgi:hypothetical protein